MENITKAILEESVERVLTESTVGPNAIPTFDVSPAGNNNSVTPSRSKEKEATETGLQPEEGFHRSSFGLTSDAFQHALKKVVKDEMEKLLSSKDKKAEKPEKNV